MKQLANRRREAKMIVAIGNVHRKQAASALHYISKLANVLVLDGQVREKGIDRSVVNNKPVLARRGLWNDKRTTNMALLRWRNHANYALSKHAWFFNRMPPSNVFGRVGVQSPSGRVQHGGRSNAGVKHVHNLVPRNFPPKRQGGSHSAGIYRTEW